MSKAFFLFLICGCAWGYNTLYSDPATFQSTRSVLIQMKVCAVRSVETEKFSKKELLEHLYNNESCLLDGVKQSNLACHKKGPLKNVHAQLKMSLENLLESQQKLIRIALGRSTDLASELAQSKVLWKKGKDQFNEAVRQFTIELEFGSHHFSPYEKEALVMEFERMFSEELGKWEGIVVREKSQSAHSLKAPDDIWRAIAISEALEKIRVE